MDNKQNNNNTNTTHTTKQGKPTTRNDGFTKKDYSNGRTTGSTPSKPPVRKFNNTGG